MRGRPARLPVCDGYVYNSHFGACGACPAAKPGGCDEPTAKLPGMLKLVAIGVCPPCESHWGLPFLITLGVAGAVLYLGGGIGYAVKTKEAAPGLAPHPHYAQMQQLAGLFQDGTKFTAAKAKAAAAGGAPAEGTAALLSGEEAAPAPEPPPAAAVEEEGDDGSSASDADVVE